MISPRAMYALSGVLLGTGVLALIWQPLIGAGLIAVGLACQWRAGVAKREATWHEWNDDR